MATHYFYLDESGNLDFEGDPESKYFGVGTAKLTGEHSKALWAGQELRITLEHSGVQLPKGLHAKDDSYPTRDATYLLLASQSWRFDSTFLKKVDAHKFIAELDKANLYRTAIDLHLSKLVTDLTVPGDEVILVAGAINISKHRYAIHTAVEEVSEKYLESRRFTLCIWDAATCFGIQVVDYFLWRVQRELYQRTLPNTARLIDPLIMSTEFPWGK